MRGHKLQRTLTTPTASHWTQSKGHACHALLVHPVCMWAANNAMCSILMLLLTSQIRPAARGPRRRIAQTHGRYSCPSRFGIFSAKCTYLSIFNLSASQNRRPFPMTGDCTHTLHPPPPCTPHTPPAALHPGCPTRLLNLYIFTHCRCTRAATTGCALLSSLPS